ncbi:uncharacterized protein N7483_007387 [Penicillium malachiteum]|uniref:uncharacterized protein n=1 Tax=Penicillium malachiteum TaxID=1324776 RepID=UPI002548504A|nr:uncharacterized protein N7483_007387 [Penicillium malachiteum]KAJ5726030.1 hypothetical protein N7483_007387 [Penicillium malachiteum]
MILRKACTNCTTSKRKCVVEKPKCTRCAQRNLECVYDLEPLKTPPTNAERLVALGFDPLSAQSVGVCIINTVTLQGPHIDPAICAPGLDRTVHITRIGFGTAPGLIRAGKPASFVHPKLNMQGVYNHFAALIEGKTIGVHSEGFKQLIRLERKRLCLKEALTAVQVLLVHLEASAFSSSRAERDDADRSLVLLSEWTQALFGLVDTRLPKGSPWQDWLLGESIRRTIFMSYVLHMSVHSYKHGYCPNYLFMESLPFDARPGLWMAESPHAWIAAAHARCGEDVGEELTSYHTFAAGVRGQTLDFGGDVLLTLAAFAHNGAGTKPVQST